MSGNRWASESEDHYGGRADVCARMFCGSEMPLTKRGNGSGGERFQAAQNFYGIELALIADTGGENYSPVRVGVGWIPGLDGDERERGAVDGTFFNGSGGIVFVI